MNNGMNTQTGQPIPDTFFKSFWDSVDDQDLKPEVKDFYQKFLQRNEKLKAEVVSYDILQDENKKKYAVYNIKVTIDHLTYTIQKRFTEFDEFRNNLRDKNPDLDLTQANFPTKTYFPFGGTSIETIDKRKVGFNDFLQLLVQKCKSQNLLDFLQFLDLKGRTEKAFNNQAPVEKQYINNTQEVTKLVEFLDLLNRNPHDTSKILQEMQNFYTDKRPKVTADIIRALLVGKPKSQGLVHFCGKIDPNANSHIVCTVGLKFLQSLMDHQKCQDADNFIAIYGNLDPKLIAMLNLSEHIEGKKQCKGAALQLADVFLNRNPKLTPNQILTKSEALQAFEAWKRTKITTFTTAERLADRLEDTEEAKDQEEYGLSPQGSSMGSLTEIAEKGFPSAQLTWSTLYKDDYIRIRYNGGRYLAVTIKADTTFEDCLRELAKGIDYRALCEESTVINKLEDDTEVCLIKVRMDMPPWKHFALVSERRVQEESSEQVVLLERPAKKYSVMFSNTDLQIKRFTNIIIKQYHKTKGKNVKVKILVKNAEEGSKALQDHLVKEEEGKFLIESCKSFLEAVEKKN